MDKQPLVSIITPTYNHERFIGQCIESVLAQTYPHWEQIIIDDGSTDKTAEIVSHYKDERIRYMRQDNAGIWRLGETYNKALNISRGEIVAVLEGDDFWPPDKLEKQVPVFIRHEVVLSWGKAVFVNSNGETICVSHRNLNWFKKTTREKVLRKMLLHNFVSSSTVMCRKDALLSIGGFSQPEYAPYVDHPTWIELSLIGEVCAVDEIIGYWRRYRDQVSMGNIAQIAEAHNRYSIDFFEHLPQELKNSLDIATDELLKQCQYRIGLSHFQLGRIKLTERKWVEAKKYFTQALDKGTLSIKTKALLGIACSCLRVDMEWCALLMCRPRLTKFL